MEAPLQRLERILSQQQPLLLVAPNAALRYEAGRTILHAIRECIAELDKGKVESIATRAVREAMTSLLTELGPGNHEMKEMLLEQLRTAKRSDIRQLLLDFMPAALDAEDKENCTARVFDVFRSILSRDSSSLLPIIGVLSFIPLSESGRCEAFQITLDSLEAVSEEELPSLVRALICHITDEKDALLAIQGIRHEMGLLENSELRGKESEDSLTMVTHVVLSAIRNFSNLLPKVYLKQLQSVLKEENPCLLLDLCVLLVLSHDPDWSDTTDALMDSWLARDVFPFEKLNSLLHWIRHRRKQEQSCSILYSVVAPLLVRLNIYLLLSPTRVRVSKTAMESIESISLSLHHFLDRERQKEHVQSLLHLAEDSSCNWDSSHAGGRKRKWMSPATEHQLTLIHKTVVNVLQILAKKAPGNLLRFKHMLTRRLTSASIAAGKMHRESIKEICTVLVSLVDGGHVPGQDGLDVSELMMLVQKLLFATTGHLGRVFGDQKRVANGIFLAAALLRLNALSEENGNVVKEWVLRILLPSTRRMVHPALGSPGLDFLDCWIQQSEDSRVVFGHFKLILANTGLIQVLSQYQASNKSRTSILAYSSIPDYFERSSQQKKVRDMVFCVNFYLRHHENQNVVSWHDSARWIFQLVDRYLRMGRSRAEKEWRPDGWLRASIELPHSIGMDTIARSEAWGWFYTHLYDFSFHSNCQGNNPRFSAEVKDSILRLGAKDRMALTKSMITIAHSIFLSIALSAAVLNNSDDYLESFQIDVTIKDRILRLVQYQMTRIYNLRSKLRHVAELFHWQCLAERRILTRNGGGFDVTEETKNLLDNQQALVHLRQVDAMLFETAEFINPKMLWCILFDQSTCDAILSPVVAQDGEHSVSISIALMLAESQMKAMNQLSSLLEAQTQKESQAWLPSKKQWDRVAAIASSLMKVLPKTRTNMPLCDQEDQSLYETLTELATSCLRLISSTLHLSSNMQVHDSLFEEYVLCLGRMMDHVKIEADHSSLSTIFSQILEYLPTTEESSLAYYLMEILTTLSVRSGIEDLEAEMLKASWKYLHTIFIHSIGQSSKQPPLAFSKALHHFQLCASSTEEAALQRTLRSSITYDTIAKPSDSPQYKFFCIGLMRHWGLLQLFEKNNSDLMQQQVSYLVSEVARALSILKSRVLGSASDEKKDEMSTINSSIDLSKQSEKSSIPGLDGTTVCNFYDLVLRTIIATFSVSSPGVEQSNSRGTTEPFEHFKEIFELMETMTRLFELNHELFPKSFAAKFFNRYRHLLSATFTQLTRCVDWRNRQPVLSVAARDAGAYDPGAVKHLRRLLDMIALKLVTPSFRICDMWEARSADPFQVNKCNRLRLASGKLLKLVNRVAITYSLDLVTLKGEESDATLSLLRRSKKLTVHGFHVDSGPEDDLSVNDTDSFSGEFQRVHYKQRRRVLNEENQVLDVEDESLSSEESSVGSFGVSGAWGSLKSDESFGRLRLS